MKLSAVVLTKNEEQNIERCLKSLTFCDEIVVIDDYSTDKTLSIAQKYKSRIFINKLSNDFSKQRNYALKKTKGEWVIFIDADEIVSSELAVEIKNKIINDNYDGFLIQRKDFFLGKILNYGEVGDIKLLRLAKKDKGFWLRSVHEIWQIEGKIGYLKNPLFHRSHNNIKSFLTKINYYSTINAKYLKSNKTQITFIDLIIYPSIKFIHNYLLKMGFMDSIEGLIFALMMSFHSFLSRAKLYLLTYNEK